MNDNNWKTPEEMKKLIGSKAKEGDYRTLNEAVKLGTVEVKNTTNRKKVYRWKADTVEEPLIEDETKIDLDFFLEAA